MAAAIGTDPPLGNAANSFGSIRPGIATAASVVMVVSEAVARRMSACNPDVEKTAQPAFADCGPQDSHRWCSLLAGGPMFRLVIDGVDALLGSDPSRLITYSGTDRGFQDV